MANRFILSNLGLFSANFELFKATFVCCNRIVCQWAKPWNVNMFPVRRYNLLFEFSLNPPLFKMVGFNLQHCKFSSVFTFDTLFCTQKFRVGIYHSELIGPSLHCKIIAEAKKMETWWWFINSILHVLQCST